MIQKIKRKDRMSQHADFFTIFEGGYDFRAFTLMYQNESLQGTKLFARELYGRYRDTVRP
jgi:hypothetical protein